MRFTRFLLLVVVGCALFGAFAGKASAIAWRDQPCPPDASETIKVCKPDAELNKPYYLKLEAREGCTPDSVRYTMPNGALPPGLRFDTGEVAIKGTPTATGTYQFWLSVQDVPAWQGGIFWCSDDHAAERLFQLTVVPSFQIQQRQSQLAIGQVGKPLNLPLTVTGNQGGVTWTRANGTLPPGLTLNSSSGLISGTPTTTGDFSFQIKATDSSGRSDVQTYTLPVVEPLKVAEPAVAAEVGVEFKLALAATGGRTPFTWSVSGLPSGLTVDPATGIVSGTPTASGTSTWKVTATDKLGLSQTVDFTVQVAGKLTIVTRKLPSAAVRRAYKARLVAIGGIAPKRWSGKLPAGLRLNTRTGAITGTPRKAGKANLSIQVIDKLGAVSKAKVSLSVSG